MKYCEYLVREFYMWRLIKLVKNICVSIQRSLKSSTTHKTSCYPSVMDIYSNNIQSQNTSSQQMYQFSSTAILSRAMAKFSHHAWKAIVASHRHNWYWSRTWELLVQTNCQVTCQVTLPHWFVELQRIAPQPLLMCWELGHLNSLR